MTDVWMRDANLRANEEENYMAKWGEIKEGGYFGGPKVVEEDVVNKPAHYGDGKIECIDYMKDNMDNMMFMGYLEGNAKK